MKKIISALLVALLLLLSMVGCAAPAKEAQLLQFEPHGTYQIVGGEYVIYRFQEPNDRIVVYSACDGYMLGEDAGQTGTFYARVTGMNGYKFLAISENYWLFESEEGKIAITLKSMKEMLGLESNIGDYQYVIIPYEELSEEEQEAFVYWFRREWKKDE